VTSQSRFTEAGSARASGDSASLSTLYGRQVRGELDPWIP